MAGFNWDEHPQEGGFDWNAHPTEPVEPENQAMSAIRGLAQGATGNFSDEIAGLGESAGRAVGLKGLGGPMKDIGLDPSGPTVNLDALKAAYFEGRNHEREALARDAKDNPATSGLSQFAGAVTSPLNAVIPGGVVAQGAGQGALMGAGSADELSDVPKDVAIGAGLGAATGQLAEYASPYIERGVQAVSDKLKGGAEYLAARALGAERGTIKSLGADKVQKAGRYALDEGLLSPLANTKDVIARNAAKMEEGGGMMGDVYKAIDDAGASTFNPLDVASKVDEKVGDFWRSPINRGETNQLEGTLESILMRGEGNIPISEAQTLKEELGKVANWKNKLNVTDKERMAREAYGVVSSSIDEAVEKAAGTIDASGLQDTLARGKDLYSKGKSAEALLENKNAREEGNKLFGLTDSIAGAGALGYGGATGDWKGAGGIVLAKKALGKYGAQNGALLADKLSQALAKSPKLAALLQSHPVAFQQLVQKMSGLIGQNEGEQKQDFQSTYSDNSILQKSQGTKYAAALQNASKNGSQGLAAANFVLQQRDPEYRKLMMKDANEGQ